MRACTKVCEITLCITGNIAVFQIGNQIQFVAVIFEHFQSFFFGNLMTNDLFTGFGNFFHLFFDCCDILITDNVIAKIDIVVESLCYNRSNPEFCLWIQVFDCLSHQGKDIMINIKESGAHAGTVFTPRPYDPKEMSVEEAAMGAIRLEGNFLVNFKFTWALNYPTSRSFVICGPEGGIDAENMKLYKNVGHYQAETDLKYFDNRAYNDVKAFDGHWYMYEHVLRVLKGEEERIVKPRETLNVVASIECFYRSAAEGREVRAEELEGYDYEG